MIVVLVTVHAAIGLLGVGDLSSNHIVFLLMRLISECCTALKIKTQARRLTAHPSEETEHLSGDTRHLSGEQLIKDFLRRMASLVNWNALMFSSGCSLLLRCLIVLCMFSLSGIADRLRKSSFLFNNKLRNTETDVLLFLKIQGLMLLRIILHLSFIAQFFCQRERMYSSNVRNS